MKTYVMCDIHGSMYAINRALEVVNIEKDRLFLLGDYVERGSEPTKTLDFLIEHNNPDPDQPGIHCLIGNHDVDLYTSLVCTRQPSESVQEYDRMIYKKCIKDSLNKRLCDLKITDINRYIKFYSKLPAAIITTDKATNRRIVLVHAGIDLSMVDEKRVNNIPWTELDQDLVDYMVWARESFYGSVFCKHLTIVGHTPTQTIRPWPEFYKNLIKQPEPTIEELKKVYSELDKYRKYPTTDNWPRPIKIKDEEFLKQMALAEVRVSEKKALDGKIKVPANPLYSKARNIILMDTGGVFETLCAGGRHEYYYTLLNISDKKMYKITKDQPPKAYDIIL